MVYNFSDAFISQQGPRLELQLEHYDEIMTRRAAFTFDEDAFGTALANSTCGELEKIGRILSVPYSIKRMTKDDAVQQLIKTLQERPYFDQKFHDPETGKAWGVEIIYDVSLSPENKCPTRWVWGSRGDDYGNKLVCYLLDRFKFIQVNHVPPTCGRKTVNEKNILTVTPMFGVNGTSDCPNKYVQVKKGGCCIRVEDVVSMNERDQELLVRKETFNLMTEEEKAVYINHIKDDMQVVQEELRELAGETPGVQALSMTVLASLQRGMIRKLSERFQFILDSTDDDLGEDVLCHDKPWIPESLAQAVTVASKGVKGFVLTLWAFVKQLMGYSWRAVTMVVGGVSTLLTSAADKMAAWMVMSPRSARVFLAYVKTYKVRMCKYLADAVVNVGEEFGLLERFEAPPTPFGPDGSKAELVLRNQARFIQAVKTTDVLARASTASTLPRNLEAEGFDKIDGSYSYLLGMKVSELTSDHATALLAQLASLSAPTRPAMSPTPPAARPDSMWSTAKAWLATTKDTVDANVEFATKLASDAGINSRIAQKVLGKITDKGVAEIGTTFLKRTLGSIPVLGGIAQAAMEITTDAFTEVVSEVTEQLFYANDLTATFTMLFEILDVGECLKYAPKIRSKYPFVLQWIEWIEIQKAKRSNRPNAVATVMDKQQEDRTETTVFSDQLKGVGKTVVAGIALPTMMGGRSKTKTTRRMKIWVE
jgi:hypothetical protein